MKAPKLKEQVQAVKAHVLLLSKERCEKKTKGLRKGRRHLAVGNPR